MLCIQGLSSRSFCLQHHEHFKQPLKLHHRKIPNLAETEIKQTFQQQHRNQKQFQGSQIRSNSKPRLVFFIFNKYLSVNRIFQYPAHWRQHTHTQLKRIYIYIYKYINIYIYIGQCADRVRMENALAYLHKKN